MRNEIRFDKGSAWRAERVFAGVVGNVGLYERFGVEFGV